MSLPRFVFRDAGVMCTFGVFDRQGRRYHGWRVHRDPINDRWTAQRGQMIVLAGKSQDDLSAAIASYLKGAVERLLGDRWAVSQVAQLVGLEKADVEKIRRGSW